MIEIVFLVLIYLLVKFVINDMETGYHTGKASLSLITGIIMPFVLILVFISLIYQIAIRPRRTVRRNYWIKNSNGEKEEYNNLFCEKICKPIIEYVVPNSIFEHNNGISKEQYESMGFSNNHDKFSSMDNIKLNSNNNLIMSKVFTQFKDGGAYGYWYTTMFCGIASIQSIATNIPINIKIRNKGVGSLKFKNAIQTDNIEFNQYYEIETSHPELLNKYISDKILDYLINLAKNNINLEVNILGNRICIRLHDKDFLQFSVNDDKYNEDKIIDNCNSIIAVININNFFANEFRNII